MWTLSETRFFSETETKMGGFRSRSLQSQH